MYQLYERRAVSTFFFLIKMSGPTYLMLHARIVQPTLSSSYAKASESSNSFPDAEAFLSSPSAENN